MPDVGNTFPWPRLVFWETTAACNLTCSHCRRGAGGGPGEEDLSTVEAQGLIHQIAARGRSVLVLSGGEPLLRDDLYELAGFAVRGGLIVALASNGTLIDDTAAAAIRDCGISRVSISLDGVEPDGHDEFRRQAGAFAAAMRGIDALRAAGVPLQINVTVTRHNVNQLDEFVSLANRLGAVALHFFLLVPVGCGLQICEGQTIDATTYEDTLIWLYETERRERRLELKATCAPHYFRVLRQRRVYEYVSDSGVPPSVSRHAAIGSSHAPGHPSAPADVLRATTRGCLAGSGICFVSHAGKVYGCGYLPIEAGDVRRDGFASIWQNSELFAKLRSADALQGKCGHCGFRGVCGGCRARAYGYTGDYLAEEPLCSYEPPDLHGGLTQ